MPEVMPEKIRELFFIFKDAIERERGAQALYKNAAALSEDSALKKVLMGFYKDEVRHEKGLLTRYNRLRRKYKVD